MQTRKKGAARNAPGDNANPKSSRQPRRATQTAAAEKKVNDLITSSAKKQKSVGIPSKKNRASKGGRKLISARDAADTENEVPEVVPGTSSDQKHSDDNVDDRPHNCIFSPVYHHQKECGVSNFAKGLEHKGDTLGSASPIEEDKTHDHGRKEATTVRSGSNQVEHIA